MPEALLSENTRVIVSISTLLIVIGFTITATFTFTTWKTQTDDRQLALETKIIELDQENKEQHGAIEETVQLLKIDAQNNRTDLTEIKIELAKINSDIGWVVQYLKDDK